MEEQNTTNIPKKRNNPFEKIVKESAENIVKKVEEAKKTTKKASSTTPKKDTNEGTIKSSSKAKSASNDESGKSVAKTKTSGAKTTKASSEASTKTKTKESTSTSKTKKVATKTTTKSKVNPAHITSTKIDPRTGLVKTTKGKTPKEEKTKTIETPVLPKKKETKKKTTKKPPVLTIEPQPKPKEPEVIVRPTPKKTKQWTKEEKILYKKLDESFSVVANMGMVIEERTMDTKNMPNLTIGEIHLIEMVNRYNNKPMTLIANKLHITVGAMTICLNRLVQKGYLLRTRDEMDRRVILLSITQEGKKILKFHNKFHDDILGIVLDTIPLAQATKVMSQFAYVLEYYFDPSIALQEEKKTSKKEKK